MSTNGADIAQRLVRLETRLADIMDRLAKTETRLDSADRALELATKELHRRLDDLNHAQERRDRAEATFVTRELHDAQIAARASSIQLISLIGSGVVAVLITLLGIFLGT